MSNITNHKNLVRTVDSTELPYTTDIRFNDLNGAVKMELHLATSEAVLGTSVYVYAKIVDRAEGMVPRFTVRSVRVSGSGELIETATPEASSRIYARDFLQDVVHLTRTQADELLDAVTTQAETVYLIGVSASILGEVK